MSINRLSNTRLFLKSWLICYSVPVSTCVNSFLSLSGFALEAFIQEWNTKLFSTLMENLFRNTNKCVLTNINHSSSHLFWKLWKFISEESQEPLWWNEIRITVLPYFLASLALIDSRCWMHASFILSSHPFSRQNLLSPCYSFRHWG